MKVYQALHQLSAGTNFTYLMIHYYKNKFNCTDYIASNYIYIRK